MLLASVMRRVAAAGLLAACIEPCCLFAIGMVFVGLKCFRSESGFKKVARLMVFEYLHNAAQPPVKLVRSYVLA